MFEIKSKKFGEESHFCYHSVLWLVWHLSSVVIHAQSQEISKSALSMKCYLLLQKRNPLKHRRNHTIAKVQRRPLVKHIYSGV